MSSGNQYFFIHVGKAGGTYLSAALRALSKKTDVDIQFTSHQGRITDILRENPCARVIFAVRDPLEIFVSGFYSRQRKGAPRYYSEWSARESKAFAKFNTANELAEALSADDLDLRRAAADAMQGIKHVRKNLRGYLHGPTFLRNKKHRIHFIFHQATLDDDLNFIYQVYGSKVPARILNSERLRHENPSGIDKQLSERAHRNLVEHYKKDLQIYQACLALREEILKNFESHAIETQLDP